MAKKIQTAVKFPEVLDVMRSGEYALCGAGRHHGRRLNEGHYDVYCRMDEIGPTPLPGQRAYCLFDCLSTSQSVVHSWEALANQKVQKSVTLLLYARVTEWNSVGVAASQETPYERGAKTHELLLEGI